MPPPWLSLGEGGPPADEFVGPFPLSGFIGAWWASLGAGEPHLVEAGDATLALTEQSGLIQIAGDSDLTDYHSPLGDDLEALGGALGDLVKEGYRLSLDSLPEGSATRLTDGLRVAGCEATVEPDVVAMVLATSSDIPFLETIDKRQRHEVRRKRRRYRDLLGEPEVDTDRAGAFERFAELHRRSPGRKGRFMKDERESFFEDLSRQDGWRVDELFNGDRSVAALFGYADADTYYLYNSAYDNDVAEASPGIVLLTHTIERLGEDGFSRFDFLKGDEEYKGRLGASLRQLYRIEA
ncbi:MAG TPA: GNAT family N-acetyltransferase [Acidimicrobiia bacterium]